MSSLGIEPDIDLEELLRVSASDEWSIQFSPMLRGPGGEQGGTFIRQAVAWKGLQKNPGESFGDYQDRLADVNEGVAEGLGEARELAMEHASGVTGVALIDKGGQVYPVPAGAAELAEAQGNASIVSRHDSVNSAIDRMVASGEGRPRFPTVY